MCKINTVCSYILTPHKSGFKNINDFTEEKKNLIVEKINSNGYYVDSQGYIWIGQYFTCNDCKRKVSSEEFIFLNSLICESCSFKYFTPKIERWTGVVWDVKGKKNIRPKIKQDV